VWYGQPWFLDDTLPVEQNVEVDGSRTGTVVLISPQRSLNLLECREKTPGCDIGFNLDYPIEKPSIPRVGFVPNRFCFI
jgi:hypothetical protein